MKEIVIKIDENVFTRLFDNGMSDYSIVNDDLFAVAKSIRNGKVLPKGHGRIIDEDEIPGDGGWDFSDRLMSTPTIIEADKAESEDKE